MENFDLPVKFELFMYTLIDTFPYFLILKRSLADGGFWQPITGTLEAFESFPDCVVREVREETGINLDRSSLSSLIHEFTWNNGSKLIYEYAYYAKLDNIPTVTLSLEHTDFKWIPYQEVRKMLEKESNVTVLDKIYSSINSS